MDACIQVLEAPLLPPLLEVIGDLQWITSQAAVDVFKTLVASFAGPRELKRWKQVKNKLTIFDCCPRPQVQHPSPASA
jgi:hypothetical protein